VASEPGVASTSREAQAMDIDSEQSTHSQTESEDKTPDTSQLGNMGPQESSELQQPASVSDHFVIQSVCYLCNKCILIHKTFISFHISTRI
jgi:hypothetical protein